LARYEVEHRDAFTTPYHLQLDVESGLIPVVEKLDGSFSVSELQGQFGKGPVEQTLQLLGKWGLMEK